MSLASLETPTASPGYLTREQQLARQHHTCAPYLCLENGLCRAFLEAGRSATDFEGVKLLFPFVREAVLMQVPREQKTLDDWMYFAFFCGYDLGTRRPDLMPEVLSDHELHQCRSRLLLLQRYAGCERPNGRALHRAFVRVIEEKWPNTPSEQLNAVFAEAALKSLRAGFGAATIGQLEPELCDFYGALPPEIRSKFQGILWQSWIGAAADSVALSVLERLEHPVLRVVRQLYPAQPTECAMVQGFLREHLQECGAKSERDCPASDAELIDWVAAGMSYGQRMVREQPEMVSRILAENEVQRLEDSVSVVQELVAEAGGINPVSLLPALKRWQKRVYDEDEPRFYGEAVQRVALFADFAVWIPWGLSQPPVKPKPKKDSGASGPSAHIQLSAD
ncbi:MAG: hypothetical protein WBS33_17945 [Verrucomicrobiia bacterium]